jgi:hypothetical protein
LLPFQKGQPLNSGQGKREKGNAVKNTSVKFPDVAVRLSGHDGNIYMIMGTVIAVLRRAGHGDAEEDFTRDVTSSDSYEQALSRVMNWVTVT